MVVERPNVAFARGCFANIVEAHTNTLPFSKNGAVSVTMRRGDYTTVSDVTFGGSVTGMTLHPCLYFYKTSLAQSMAATRLDATEARGFGDLHVIP